MFSNGSKECLHNSKNLLENAKLLCDNSSFGPAQSLAIISLEEAGKAVILELANSGRITKDVVKLAMTGGLAHLLKKIVVFGLEQGKFLLDEELIGGDKEPILGDKDSIEKLQKDIKVGAWEAKRQNGFYVNVDHENGNITNNPSNLDSKEVLLTIKQAQNYLVLCGGICDVLKTLRERPSLSSFIIRRVEVPSLRQLETGEDSDQDITIVFDEV